MVLRFTSSCLLSDLFPASSPVLSVSHISSPSKSSYLASCLQQLVPFLRQTNPRQNHPSPYTAANLTLIHLKRKGLVGEDGVEEGGPCSLVLKKDPGHDSHTSSWEQPRFNSSLITSKQIISGLLSFCDHCARLPGWASVVGDCAEPAQRGDGRNVKLNEHLQSCTAGKELPCPWESSECA